MKNKELPFVVFISLLLFSFLIVIFHLLFHSVRVLDMSTSIFYMDEKYTLAAFFTTVVSFLTGFSFLTFAYISKKGRQKNINSVLGIFFVYLAFDEYFEIHEYANTVVKSLITDGFAANIVNLSWVFSFILIIIAVLYLFFLKILLVKDRFIKRHYLTGVFCFLIVIIFEILGAMTFGNNIYLYLVAVEEGLEMIGITFFLYAHLLERGKYEIT